ncbi:MAG TPA: hypothetical protein DHV62_08005 [Elusimicrobia bacterium]|jgi:hypothetical protein|nr:hypothetical protein [Elusimicrobiota bacterium]
MKSIYLLSAQPYSGKSLIIVGLGLHFQEEGLQVGYFKPFGTAIKGEAGSSKQEVVSPALMASQKGGIEEDAYSVKEVLGLKEAIEKICPVLVTRELISNILSAPPAGEAGKSKENFLEKITTNFNSVAKGKDLVFIDGAGDFSEGCIFDLPVEKIVEITKSKVILVLKYEQDIILDILLRAKDIFKDNFLGAIINYVPLSQIDYFTDVILPYLEKRKIEIFAFFPKDILLAAVTVREIVEHLNAQVLCGKDKLDELVENFTVGAMHPEHALRYFRKIANKAVITGGDRADIQLAALETATKCLILTGNLRPDSLVLCKAVDLGIPMLSVAYDTFTTVELIEEITKKIPFHGARKIERMKELFKTKFDFKKFKTLLGI